MLTCNFDNSFAQQLLPHSLGTACQPEQASEPRLVYLNETLAHDLGLLSKQSASQQRELIAEYLSGNRPIDGASPIAQAYAGHQFGQFNPQLGDGRALILGEHVTAQGNRIDICLKGSGRTPYSRGGDGKAGIGPMLREVLIAEAMHALGIPTTRSLAVVSTGDLVFRNQASAGAVLTRLASSHIRIGTFEFLAARRQTEDLRALADYTIARHHPDLLERQDRYQALLRKTIDIQAHTIAKWMGVGFIHGVMNTDNMLISGETIDYGPCAFMDSYSTRAVFSSIDHGSRYAYGNQAAIAQWNLTRFAETLLPLIQQETTSSHEAAIEIASEQLRAFEQQYKNQWLAVFRAKLGFSKDQSSDNDARVEADIALINQYLNILESTKSDFTNSFRLLSSAIDGEPQSVDAQFLQTAPAQDWLENWRARLKNSGHDSAEISQSMNPLNPAVIPRNQLVEIALDAAENQGDTSLFESLLAEITDPYRERDADDPITKPGSASFYRSFQTFCGT